jgi:hypothetical protein
VQGNLGGDGGGKRIIDAGECGLHWPAAGVTVEALIRRRTPGRRSPAQLTWLARRRTSAWRQRDSLSKRPDPVLRVLQGFSDLRAGHSGCKCQVASQTA